MLDVGSDTTYACDARDIRITPVPTAYIPALQRRTSGCLSHLTRHLPALLHCRVTACAVTARRVTRIPLSLDILFCVWRSLRACITLFALRRRMPPAFCALAALLLLRFPHGYAAYYSVPATSTPSGILPARIRAGTPQRGAHLRAVHDTVIYWDGRLLRTYL